MAKSRFQRMLAGFADRILPPRLLKHQIAWRNWRRGEPELRLLGELVPPERLAVDVGAHQGAYTYFLLRHCRGVHAFEPQPRYAEFLRRAYRDAVTVHECALADAHETGHLLVPTRGPQAARLDATAGIAVSVRTLDEFGYQDLGFIKIDAEGAEARILRGATATLARCRPRLLIEIEARHLAMPIDAVFAQVQAHGYRGRYWHAGCWQPLAGFSVENGQLARLRGDLGKPYINNFVFDPI